jgi:hypothetical protein
MASKKIILKLLQNIAKDKGFKIVENAGEWMAFKKDCFKTQWELGGFYHLVGQRYLTFGGFEVSFDELDSFVSDYKGESIARFYYAESKKITFLSEDMLYYLKIQYGEEMYPKGIYNTFTIEQVEETPELVYQYIEKEYYQKGYLNVEEKYGTIALADQTINSEIITNCDVKKHNLNYVDFDNHCIRSILVAHFNNNPNIDKLVEICNNVMTEEKVRKPENPRIPLYNFILEKLGYTKI